MIINVGGPSIPKFNLPLFSYTGQYQLINEGKAGPVQNWKLRFLTSGTLVFTRVTKDCEVFMVGGGGGGGAKGKNGDFATPYGGGGGGGYMNLANVTVANGIAYAIVVGKGGAHGNGDIPRGSNGEASSAFGVSAAGGGGGNGALDAKGNSNGGSGSSGGGAGRSDKRPTAGNGGSKGTNGQGSETGRFGKGGGRGLPNGWIPEFNEPNGAVYGGGGGGYGAQNGEGTGFANSGGGAPGGLNNGYSGIVILRNRR